MGLMGSTAAPYLRPVVTAPCQDQCPAYIPGRIKNFIIEGINEYLILLPPTYYQAKREKRFIKENAS